MEYLEALNSNTFFVGLMILLTTIGSRFIVLEVSSTLEDLIRTEIMRKVVIFAMCFVACRDIVKSFILTAVFTILVSGLFHDESDLCVLPKTGGRPTEAQVSHAREILKRAEEHASKTGQKAEWSSLQKEVDAF